MNAKRSSVPNSRSFKCVRFAYRKSAVQTPLNWHVKCQIARGAARD
jgi:hypothetical protein